MWPGKRIRVGGKKSLKVIDLAPPKVNLTLTRFEGPRGRVGEAGGRAARRARGGSRLCAGRGHRSSFIAM